MSTCIMHTDSIERQVILAPYLAHEENLKRQNPSHIWCVAI